MRKKLTGLILLVFGVQLTVIAQSGLYFYTWNADDGLASNTFTVTQDKDEFIWVGTMDGIARFDSFTFELDKVKFRLVVMSIIFLI